MPNPKNPTTMKNLRNSKVLQAEIKTWSTEKIAGEFTEILNTAHWSNSTCSIVCQLLKVCPRSLVRSNLELLAHRCNHLLQDADVKSTAVKVFEGLACHLDIETWDSVFVPILANEIPSSIEARKDYVRKKLWPCCWLIAKAFNINKIVFELLTKVCITYQDPKLFCTMSNIPRVRPHGGEILKVMERVRNYHLMDNDEIENFIFQTLCTWGSKDFAIPESNLRVFKFLLSRCFMLGDCLDLSPLHFLLSHMCIRFVYIVHDEMTDEEEEELDLYCDFVQRAINIAFLSMEKGSTSMVKTAAVVIKTIRDVIEGNSQSLRLRYALPGRCSWEEGEGPFYIYLVDNSLWGLTDANLCKKLIPIIENHPPTSEVTSLMKSVKFEKDISLNLVKKGIQIMLDGKTYNDLEKGETVFEIGLLDNDAFEIDDEFRDDFINEFLSAKNVDVEVQNYVGMVKYLEALLSHSANTLPRYRFAQKLFTHCEGFMRLTMTRITHNDVEINKKLEHVIIMYLNIMKMLVLAHGVPVREVEVALGICQRVIQTSEMRRPITVAAEVIKKLTYDALNREYDIFEYIIRQFLNNTLASIKDAPVMVSRIRRAPSFRLIIHAIVTADKRYCNFYTEIAMTFLLNEVFETEAAPYSLAVSFHVMELLLQDVSIQAVTQQYVVAVAKKTIDWMHIGEWGLANAAIQAFKAATERMLGNVNGASRSNSLEDVAALYPDFIEYIIQKLQQPPNQLNHDTQIVILSFLAACHRSYNALSPVKLNVNPLLAILSDQLMSDDVHLNRAACNAYVAISSHRDIPQICRNMAGWLMSQFPEGIRHNVMHTFLHLLFELEEKYNKIRCLPYYQKGLSEISMALGDVTRFINASHSCNCLPVMLSTGYMHNLQSLMANLGRHIQDTESYQSRLWLYRYLPCMLQEATMQDFCQILKACLVNSDPSCFIVTMCINAVIARYPDFKLNHYRADVSAILINTYFHMFETLSVYDRHGFHHSIFLVLENEISVISQDTLMTMRRFYKHRKMSYVTHSSVFIRLLTDIPRNQEDKDFIKSVFVSYKRGVVCDDPDINYQVVTSLPYLYKCIEHAEECAEVLLCAYILIFNNPQQRLFEFLAHVFNLPVTHNRTDNYERLVNYNKLVGVLGTPTEVGHYYCRVYEFLSGLKDYLEDNGRYYLKQNSAICQYQNYLKNDILGKLRVVLPNMPPAFREELRRRCDLDYI